MDYILPILTLLVSGGTTAAIISFALNLKGQKKAKLFEYKLQQYTDLLVLSKLYIDYENTKDFYLVGWDLNKHSEYENKKLILKKLISKEIPLHLVANKKIAEAYKFFIKKPDTFTFNRLQRLIQKNFWK